MASGTTGKKRQVKAKRSMPAPRRPAKRTLSNAQLLKLAKQNPPPQTWFDQTDVPFIPRKD